MESRIIRVSVWAIAVLCLCTSIVTAQPVTVTVSGQRDIVLAGAPDGRQINNDSSPLNAPVLVPVTVTAGQLVQVSATGSVDVSGSSNPQTPPDGSSSSRYTNRAFGISRIDGPAGALIGVFLGPDDPNGTAAPPDVDFSGSARDMVTLNPLLQQPFYIGRGKTSSGATKNFVVPAGATRVFLGVLDYSGSNSDNTGSFTVNVSLASPPPPAIYPSVFAVTDISLAGAPDGRQINNDSSPLNEPVLVPVTVTAGQLVQVSATGSVDVSGSSNPQTPPDGSSSSRYTNRTFGISSIQGPAGALIGVFLGPDDPNGSAAPPDVDFTGSARDMVTLNPLLQQPFYIGRGKTSSGATKNFVVPAGATRLFLGVLDYSGSNGDNTGLFTVTVSVVSPPPPLIYPSVFAVTDISLAGAPPGRQIFSDSSPLNAPVLVPISVEPGQSVLVNATGVVDVNGSSNPQTPPDGSSSSRYTNRAFGISSIQGPAGALIGVFLGPDDPNGSLTPPDVDFTGSARDLLTLHPLLQQPFYIGRGKTSGGATKNFVVPAGATRLFLGVLDYSGSNSNNTGLFTVMVGPIRKKKDQLTSQ